MVLNKISRIQENSQPLDLVEFPDICFCEESEGKRLCQGAWGFLGWCHGKAGSRKIRGAKVLVVE